MPRTIIQLPADRRRPGTLTVYADSMEQLLQIPCRGTDAAATGTYRITKADIDGIVLYATSGEAQEKRLGGQLAMIRDGIDDVDGFVSMRAKWPDETFQISQEGLSALEIALAMQGQLGQLIVEGD